MATIAIPEFTVPFTFQRRPTSIPADLRPSWRIGVVLLLMRKCCRGNKSSFGRLHVLGWGVRSRATRLALTKAANGNMPLDALIVRVEPSLNRAVDFAIGEGLIKRLPHNRLQLTPIGVAFADDIERQDGLFATEKQLIAAIGMSITESLVSDIFRKEA